MARLQLLLSRESLDVNRKDEQGMNPLLVAAFKGHTLVVAALLQVFHC